MIRLTKANTKSTQQITLILQHSLQLLWCCQTVTLFNNIGINIRKPLQCFHLKVSWELLSHHISLGKQLSKGFYTNQRIQSLMIFLTITRKSLHNGVQIWSTNDCNMQLIRDINEHQFWSQVDGIKSGLTWWWDGPLSCPWFKILISNICLLFLWTHY
jgi:hypothetical protein